MADIRARSFAEDDLDSQLDAEWAAMNPIKTDPQIQVASAAPVPTPAPTEKKEEPKKDGEKETSVDGNGIVIDVGMQVLGGLEDAVRNTWNGVVSLE